MSASPLDPQGIRAAAEAHKELGPEYSDAVIESFLERVDREITARVDARLGPVSREQPVQPAQSNSRRTLLTGVAIGIFVTGVPSMLVATSGGTLVRMEHSGFRADQEAAYQGANYGWQKFIGGLERVVAGLQ